MSEENNVDPQSGSSGGEAKGIVLKPVTIIVYLTVTLLIIAILLWPYLQTGQKLPWAQLFSKVPTPTSTADTMAKEEYPTPDWTPIPSATLPFIQTNADMWSQGQIIIALQDGLESHLFAYKPVPDQNGKSLGLVRLTNGSWKDIHPAIHPKFDRLAFASNRNGFWNIYQLDLRTGEVNQFSNSPDYQAAPTWSPDGMWIGYEAHVEDNLDIYLQQVDGEEEPIQLTNHLGADFDPAWGPDGRHIAFISDRGGKNQVWLANLDDTSSNRFQLLSGIDEVSSANPVWSPDGRYLAWSGMNKDGLQRIYLWDSQEPKMSATDICAGNSPAWSPDGRALAVIFETPFESFLMVYSMGVPHHIQLPPLKLPSASDGLLWAEMQLSGDIVIGEDLPKTRLWQGENQIELPGFEGRWNLVELDDVEAPYPQLHQRADEAFQEFREKLTSLVGWDLLVDLENAFIPLSTALSPGLSEDWLYTGRAFAFKTLPIRAGWMTVTREDFGQETYWRIYIRTRFQDGSQGQPLRSLPWDFNARYRGDPLTYEQGGDFTNIVPPGYWVDFTQVAAQYGWQRLPALANWHSSYTSARYNEYVFTEGLAWEDAMLEIYPPEVLLTLTPLPTISAKATESQYWFPTSTTTPISSPTATTTVNPSPTITATRTTTLTKQTITATVGPSTTPTATKTTTR